MTWFWPRPPHSLGSIRPRKPSGPRASRLLRGKVSGRSFSAASGRIVSAQISLSRSSSAFCSSSRNQSGSNIGSSPAMADSGATVAIQLSSRQQRRVRPYPNGHRRFGSMLPPPPLAGPAFRHGHDALTLQPGPSPDDAMYALSMSRAHTSAQLRAVPPVERPVEGRYLYQIINTVSSTLDVDRVLRAIVDLVSEAIDCHACFVYSVEPQDGSLVLRAVSEPYDALVDRLRFNRGEGFAGWVAERDQPLFIPANALADPRIKVVPEAEE